MPRGFSAEATVTIDTRELRSLIQRIKQVDDAKVKRELRKALRTAGASAVEGVRSEVLKPVPRRMGKGKTRSTGLRADIARSTKVSVLAGSAKRGAQVRIVSKTRQGGPHSDMAKAYNARMFRHPVDKAKRHWVSQRGQANYFGKGVYDKRAEMERQVWEAMVLIGKTLARRR